MAANSSSIRVCTNRARRSAGKSYDDETAEQAAPCSAISLRSPRPRRMSPAKLARHSSPIRPAALVERMTKVFVDTGAT